MVVLLIREMVPLAGLALLSQLPAPSGPELSTWFVCAAAAMLIIERGVSLYKNLSSGAAYVTTAECERSHQETERRFADGERRMNSLTALITDTRSELNDRINYVGDRVSEAIGEIRRISRP